MIRTQFFQPTLMMADFINDGCVSSNLQQKLQIEAKLMHQNGKTPIRTGHGR